MNFIYLFLFFFSFRFNLLQGSPTDQSPVLNLSKSGAGSAGGSLGEGDHSGSEVDGPDVAPSPRSPHSTADDDEDENMSDPDDEDDKDQGKNRFIYLVMVLRLTTILVCKVRVGNFFITPLCKSKS